jgi:hypothetical protein
MYICVCVCVYVCVCMCVCSVCECEVCVIDYWRASVWGVGGRTAPEKLCSAIVRAPTSMVRRHASVSHTDEVCHACTGNIADLEREDEPTQQPERPVGKTESERECVCVCVSVCEQMREYECVKKEKRKKSE